MSLVPRVSRQYLDDRTLERAKAALLVQVGSMHALEHSMARRDLTAAADDLAADREAVEAVLAILVVEQRERRTDDRELSAP